MNAMIALAVEKRASDIHIEPFEKEFRVRYRVDGVLVNQDEMSEGSEVGFEILAVRDRELQRHHASGG
jgi:type II secretory ATPase GspE/PulE/Tfp pilus assembly ATPase PilB-like protein